MYLRLKENGFNPLKAGLSFRYGKTYPVGIVLGLFQSLKSRSVVQIL